MNHVTIKETGAQGQRVYVVRCDCHDKVVDRAETFPHAVAAAGDHLRTERHG